MYNIAVSGVVLALTGAIGLVGNLLVVAVYTCPEQRIFSTSIYLAALAVSDFSMICTAMFLFVLEAWRHHGPPGKHGPPTMGWLGAPSGSAWEYLLGKTGSVQWILLKAPSRSCWVRLGAPKNPTGSTQ